MKKKISLNPPKLFLQTNPVDDSDHIASYIGRKLNDCPIYVLVYQWLLQCIQPLPTPRINLLALLSNRRAITRISTPRCRTFLAKKTPTGGQATREPATTLKLSTSIHSSPRCCLVGGQGKQLHEEYLCSY